MKKYEDFKNAIDKLIKELGKEGKEVVAKKWAKISPYQKRRYKTEYTYPEVWIYRKGFVTGVVITGDELLEWEKIDSGIKGYIINSLF